jgi:hypothetical protein
MIKKPILTLALISILTFALGSQALAADHSRRGTSPPAADSHSFVSESPTYSSGGSSSFALGFSTGFLATSNNVLGTHSLAALVGLHNGDMIDLRFSLPSTSPFNFGLGALYKHVINQHGGAGFHIGGGFGIGDVSTQAVNGAGNVVSTGNFALAFSGIIGFHFELPGVSAVSIHFDGGPSFTLITSSPSQTNFGINPLSGVLGASIFYTF